MKKRPLNLNDPEETQELASDRAVAGSRGLRYQVKRMLFGLRSSRIKPVCREKAWRRGDISPLVAEDFAPVLLALLKHFRGKR